MSSIHYKFRATLELKTLQFDGLHILGSDLKKEICAKENIKAEAFDLLLQNMHTKRNYSSDELIPRNSSIIVQRVPRDDAEKLPKIQGVNTGIVTKAEASVDSGINVSGHLNSEQYDGMSEQEKLAHIKKLSAIPYNSSNYVKRPTNILSGPPPPTYTCNKCCQAGHWFKNCPMLNTKRTTGIPSQELMETTAEDPQAMVHPSGKYVVPIMHWIARQKKIADDAPVLERVPPPELICPICNQLIKDALLTTCCGNSFCADCISQKLLESEDGRCPIESCQKIISVDALIPNKTVRSSAQAWSSGSDIHEQHRIRIGLQPTVVTIPSQSTSSGIPPGGLQQSSSSPRTDATIVPTTIINVSEVASVPTSAAPLTTQSSVLPLPSTFSVPPPMIPSTAVAQSLSASSGSGESILPPGTSPVIMPQLQQQIYPSGVVSATTALPPIPGIGAPLVTHPVVQQPQQQYGFALAQPPPIMLPNYMNQAGRPYGNMPIMTETDVWNEYLNRRDKDKRETKTKKRRRTRSRSSSSSSSSSSESEDDKRQRRKDKRDDRKRIQRTDNRERMRDTRGRDRDGRDIRGGTYRERDNRQPYANNHNYQYRGGYHGAQRTRDQGPQRDTYHDNNRRRADSNNTPPASSTTQKPRERSRRDEEDKGKQDDDEERRKDRKRRQDRKDSGEKEEKKSRKEKEGKKTSGKKKEDDDEAAIDGALKEMEEYERMKAEVESGNHEELELDVVESEGEGEKGASPVSEDKTPTHPSTPSPDNSATINDSKPSEEKEKTNEHVSEAENMGQERVEMKADDVAAEVVESSEDAKKDDDTVTEEDDEKGEKKRHKKHKKNKKHKKHHRHSGDDAEGNEDDEKRRHKKKSKKEKKEKKEKKDREDRADEKDKERKHHKKDKKEKKRDRDEEEKESSDNKVKKEKDHVSKDDGKDRKQESSRRDSRDEKDRKDRHHERREKEDNRRESRSKNHENHKAQTEKTSSSSSNAKEREKSTKEKEEKESKGKEVEKPLATPAEGTDEEDKNKLIVDEKKIRQAFSPPANMLVKKKITLNL